MSHLAQDDVSVLCQDIEFVTGMYIAVTQYFCRKRHTALLVNGCHHRRRKFAELWPEINPGEIKMFLSGSSGNVRACRKARRLFRRRMLLTLTEGSVWFAE